MKRHCVMLIAAAALATACGESRNIAGPSATTVDTIAPADGDSPKLTPRFTRGPNSCPDGDYPHHLWAHENGHSGVRLMWEEVLSIPTYIVESERLNVQNVYEREVSTSTSERFVDAMVTGGRHRFRVRTKNLCDQLGPWSEYEYYSTDFNNTPSVGVNAPAPSLPHNNDGGYGDEGNGSGQNNDRPADNTDSKSDTSNGGSNDNAGSNGGGTNAGSNGGAINSGSSGGEINTGSNGGGNNGGNNGGGNNGGSNSCKVDSSGNSGNSDHSGSDHNNDGHSDCGKGQVNH